ncbi:MAG: PIN domain-containing protein [Bifidobacteriaceae bacterium]|jgi:predicted nucleic acid-binding protein|nr:PIN domain-containing protein [Bifidobacteriaceae bacterium]
MTVYLLDSSALIALVAKGHEHWERVNRWMSGVGRFAVCPVVEGALVRFLVRAGLAGKQVKPILDLLAQRPGYQFWADAVAYRDVDLDGVLGHRQVTDAYLAALARSHAPARLATLDRGLARAHPGAALLIP